MLIPLFLLSVGAIFSGYFQKHIFIGNQSNDFWKTSIFFLNEIKHDAIPFFGLLITPILVLISIPISYYYLYFKSKNFRWI